MTGEDNESPPRRPSPSTPKKLKMESEEQPNDLLKDEDHSEEESKEFEDDDDDDDEDEDRPPPGWQQSPQSSPPLLDMIDFPPSPLPPTPPLPSSPRDLDMEQDLEDDGPPPGWDNKYQLKEDVLVTPAAAPAISSDILIEDVRQDAHIEEDIQAEQQDSEDDGPPPGWDSKCQSEPRLQMACPSTPPSDIKMENAQQDGQNEGQQTSGVPSDMKVDQDDSDDEGPPPGWDSKCQPESKLQITCTTTPQSGQTDIKMEDIQQETLNEDGPQPQSLLSHPSPAPELDPSEIKAEEQDLEDDGPPPGWNSKCQPEPNLQMSCPTTPSDFMIEKDQEADEGPPPGWGSRSSPQEQSQVHSSVPSPIVPSGMGCESNNVKVIEESPQPPPTQLSVPPTKPQMSVPKQSTTRNYPEMGQMVCGSCRHLLSYPRGARYVECACCLEENYVLEEHEVGQVVCGGCDVLLMYPYGAPKVRCANCSTETEIGDQNRRPPLSEHKRRAKQHLRQVQAS